MAYWTAERIAELKAREQRIIRRNTSWNTGLTATIPLLVIVMGTIGSMSKELSLVSSLIVAALCFGVPVTIGFVVCYFRIPDSHPISFFFTSLIASVVFLMFWSIPICAMGIFMFPIL